MAKTEGATEYRLTIPGRLPGLNEYIEAERGNRHKAAKLKAATEDAIMWCIRSQLRGVRIDRPVQMSYEWHEKDKRRDKDNVAFAKKFVQDALVKAGTLKGDGWNHIAKFYDDVVLDKKNPRVEVTIKICG